MAALINSSDREGWDCSFTAALSDQAAAFRALAAQPSLNVAVAYGLLLQRGERRPVRKDFLDLLVRHPNAARCLPLAPAVFLRRFAAWHARSEGQGETARLIVAARKRYWGCR